MTIVPDPLSQQETYAARGLAVALSRCTRSIYILGVKYTGIRTELEVTSGDAKAGGFGKERAFSILLPRTVMAVDPQDGIAVVDDLGRQFRVFNVKSDAIQVTLMCGSTNR